MSPVVRIPFPLELSANFETGIREVEKLYIELQQISGTEITKYVV